MEGTQMRMFNLRFRRSMKSDNCVAPSIDRTLRRGSTTRRALVTGGIAAAGAAIASTAKAAVTYVKLGAANTATAGTIVTNTRTNSAGLVGSAPNGASAQGVRGQSLNGIGVRGNSNNNTGMWGTGRTVGVKGESTDSSGVGVSGIGGFRGVHGSGGNAGVYGTSGYVGVWGNATSSSGLNYGVYAATSSPGGFAGVFSGKVYVSGNLQVIGTLSKGAGSFKIDHPLDPERKWLQHSFVESPDMMNVYNGNVTTDAAGYATVELPAYFGALNRDFRYQLTVIGKMAQAVVDREISRNRFRIRTSEGRVKVSWQVTGIRQDAYAREHPIRVEVQKSPAERGTRAFLPRGVHGRRMHVGPEAPLAEPSGSPQLAR
jgi:hypothetical protein